MNLMVIVRVSLMGDCEGEFDGDCEDEFGGN